MAKNSNRTNRNSGRNSFSLENISDQRLWLAVGGVAVLGAIGYMAFSRRTQLRSMIGNWRERFMSNSGDMETNMGMDGGTSTGRRDSYVPEFQSTDVNPTPAH